MNDEKFQSGMEPDAYVENLRNYRSFVRGLMREVSASPEHAQQLRRALDDRLSPVRMTVMTEDWCGDSACTLPVLADLCSKAQLPLRVFRGSEHADLHKRYNEEGVDHIPVVSIWDGNGVEIARWVESPKEVDRRKAEWKSERPEFMESYRAKENDRDAARRFAKLYRELLETMADWYRHGMWNETTREIVSAARGERAGS